MPVYTLRAAATESGRGAEAVEARYVDVVPPPEASDNLLGVDVVGDCMTPELNDGEMAIADCNVVPRIGDVVVAHPHGDKSEWIIKRIKERRGDTFVLEADNPAFAGEWTVGRLDIEGVVLSSQRRVRRRYP
jgi:SOS-response transcriptional repressor LexA